jgi:hypothetical protein
MTAGNLRTSGTKGYERAMAEIEDEDEFDYD